MRLIAVVLVLMAVCSVAAASVNSVVFRRADGSTITFPANSRTWCDRTQLHVVTFGGPGSSHWQLSVARKDARNGRAMAFTWTKPAGVEIFVYDAKTHNEASEGAEGSHGSVTVRRGSCRQGAPVEIALSGVIASEFFDGTPIRASGTFVGRVGTRPS